MAKPANPGLGQKWMDGIDRAASDPAWDLHDKEIQAAVAAFNQHLLGTTGYQPLHWQFIKAMVWVESGASSPAWKTSPIQIGNPGDPGLASLLSGKEGGELILPAQVQSTLTPLLATTTAAHSIRAGIGYLLMKLANFTFQNVADADTTVHDVTVKSGDSLDKIARAHGTTIEMLKKLNPSAQMLQPGQVLKYQKAAIKKVIIGWKPITTANIAAYYNGGGDSTYAAKLDYALSVIRGTKGPAKTGAAAAKPKS
jgi:LysM repeat protein